MCVFLSVFLPTATVSPESATSGATGAYAESRGLVTRAVVTRAVVTRAVAWREWGRRGRWWREWGGEGGGGEAAAVRAAVSTVATVAVATEPALAAARDRVQVRSGVGAVDDGEAVRRGEHGGWREDSKAVRGAQCTALRVRIVEEKELLGRQLQEAGLPVREQREPEDLRLHVLGTVPLAASVRDTEADGERPRRGRVGWAAADRLLGNSSRTHSGP